MDGLGLRGAAPPQALTVAYHSACSMQHGQQIRREPKALLAAAGFAVKEVPEGHLCCGSAGTYNLLQPAIAARLQARKVANVESTRPDVRSEEHTSELQSLMRISYAVFCLKKKQKHITKSPNTKPNT